MRFVVFFQEKEPLPFFPGQTISLGVDTSPVNSKEVVFQPEGYMTSKFILIQLIVRGECLVLTKRLVVWLVV